MGIAHTGGKTAQVLHGGGVVHQGLDLFFTVLHGGLGHEDGLGAGFAPGIDFIHWGTLQFQKNPDRDKDPVSWFHYNSRVFPRQSKGGFYRKGR